jgi:cytoskeletal protein RodZ
MAVVRSFFGRFSKDASSDLKATNSFCLGDDDRVTEPPEATSYALEDGQNNATSVAPEKFSFGLEFDDAIEQTLGQLMTETREHQRLSRDQVAAQTRIPAYYIRMIESDSYDAIPDQLYLLPFFRRYAMFLGLDEQKVVARFIRDFEKAENEIVETRTKAPRTKAPNPKLRRQLASAVLIVGLLIIFLARGIAMMRSTLHRPAESPSPVAVSENVLPPSTIMPIDAPPLSASAPRLSDSAPRLLNDAPRPLNDPPQVLTDAPHPVAALQPAETPAAAATLSPAITTASAAPHARHHHRHARAHRLTRSTKHSKSTT